MAELTVESGPLRGQTLTFTPDETFVVGSGQDCALRLDSPGIADQHLVIKALKNGGFGIKMMDGPFILNGKESAAARLRDGDLIELADTRLRFGPSKTTTKKKTLGNLGGYRLIEVLGKGGHGTVYRAEQLSLHRNVALKVLPKETTKNPEFVGRFVAEARAAARLSHANVVQVFDVDHDGDTYFLSMEIMEQGSLEDRLRKEGMLPWNECLQLITDAARGLSYAESTRIVHRDIKPDNLMVDSHGTVKIADLGLAMSDDAEQGKIVGTPHFMSPEQATGKPLDHRSDLYSLGCTFFRLVTGRPLFQRSKTKEILRAHVKDEPESADKVNSDVPAGVAAVIDQLVEKDPDDRYQSSSELIDDLQRLLHPPARRGPLIAVVAVLILGMSYAIYHFATKGNTVIVRNNGDPEEAARLKKLLRESTAETERGRILRNENNLDSLALAARFEKFAADPQYKDTPAATNALAKAVDLRAKETASRAAMQARANAVRGAKTKIEQTVRALIAEGKFSAAVAATRPTEVSAEVLGDSSMVEAVATLLKELEAAAKIVLQRLTSAVESAEARRKPEEMLLAIADIDAILDKDSGWPRQALTDRSSVVTFVSEKKREVKALRTSLESSMETSATADYYRQATTDDGVLAAIRSFDLANATKLATALAGKLENRKIHPQAAQLLTVVQAAERYWADYAAAIAAGSLKIRVDVGGNYLEVTVKGFDPKTGLKTDHADKPTIPLGTLRDTGLQRFFAVTKSGATHSQNRLAFLALQALAEHLVAARRYMDTLDPSDPASGTGDKRYGQTMLDLNYVVRATRTLDTDWQKFISKEVRASQQLARGLRAFSNQQYTRAENYLQDLRDRYQGTLILQVTRRPQ